MQKESIGWVEDCLSGTALKPSASIQRKAHFYYATFELISKMKNIHKLWTYNAAVNEKILPFAKRWYCWIWKGKLTSR